MVKVTPMLKHFNGCHAYCIYQENLVDNKIEADMKLDQRVPSIVFSHCKMYQFPSSNSLLTLVNNLTYLQISHCNLASIFGDDLKGLENLKNLLITFTELESLPKDLFVHTPNLENIKFSSSKIKLVEDGILDPLKKLVQFNMKSNPNYDIEYKANDPKYTLEDFKKEIKEKFKPFLEICEILKTNISTLKRKAVNYEREEQFKKQVSDMQKELTQLRKENGESRKELEDMRTELRDHKKKKTKVKKVSQQAEVVTVNASGKPIIVEKEILNTNSPVLAEMMKDISESNSLELPDISEETFQAVLYFMRIKNRRFVESLLEIYEASCRLQVIGLNDFIMKILLQKLTSEDAPEVMVLCKKYPNEELRKKAFVEYTKTFKFVQKTTLNLNTNCPKSSEKKVTNPK